ncbi:MAG: hypothetical protein II685_03735 [Clostridia bacterium]|nr:hypothetical protein [Clostridia bacterium]
MIQTTLLKQPNFGDAKPIKVFARLFSKGAPQEVPLGYWRFPKAEPVTAKPNPFRESLTEESRKERQITLSEIEKTINQSNDKMIPFGKNQDRQQRSELPA